MGMQSIDLDKNALQIQLAEQLLEHRSLVVVCGDITGLANHHAPSGRLQRDQRNPCVTLRRQWA
jgi:hypothetical protein